MKDKELKIGDIASLTGISERDVRRLVQTYDSLFTYRTVGPVKLFPPKAVDIVRELIELSGKDLTPEEVAEEIRSGKKPEPQGEPAEAIERAAAPLPPEVVFEIRAMQETLARQERQIARLVAELEQEREERREEAAKLQERLDAQQRELAVVAEWVDYFDRRMDEVTLPVFERVRRTLGRGDVSGRSAGRSG
ncbi:MULTISPECIES: hypothetical protein [Methanoculleus]|jgi:DNA-binding transcriptional MerR regulator|uniref:MerR HTH family regulatory protein n=1 Tax=Methanoculleus thermophilus TaxID=2200 RepID=A0A1G8WPR9_9EURY|nr:MULTISPECIES: hypothetical protein [Methanoculleus]NLN09919.1 hypothetical protein [Methanoculleus thermophilus]SDJ80047.1 hypothetical protein SAMN04488571_10131 [Methanoculleus thermophilus]HQD25014.1 hypothetical protein [Methanoculleus thermophilus]